MAETCDLCGEVIVVGEQPTYGAMGLPGRPETGPLMGEARHYTCHVDRFGRPKSFSESKQELDEAFAKLRTALSEIMSPGGTLDRVRAVTGDAPGPSYRAQGACGSCGRYAFQHPLPDCAEWEPPRGHYSGE